MAKTLESIVFNPVQCRRDLDAFRKLLASKKELAERKDIQGFFRKRKQISSFIGTYAPNIGPAPLLAYEFPFIGDYSADIVLGNKSSQEFYVVEFEDGRTNSIFKKMPNKSTTEWSPRFEHAFSQLVDWFYSLDDFRRTDRFARDFGHEYTRFFGLLILGRSSGVSPSDRKRLRWRTEKVSIDSHTIECVTLDDLYESLTMRMSYYPQASKLET